MSDAFIRIEGLKKVYNAGKRNALLALEAVDLTLKREEFVSIVGPSGCGKSTLLKLLSGLIPITQGRILIDGAPVLKPRPDIGMIFQSPVLLKWRSVLRNVLLPAHVLGLDLKECTRRAYDLLELVNLKGFEHRYPRELSGGMQQRVSLCRALLHDPSILLMDEPFGALDAMTREEMNDELLRVWTERKKTVLFITHSIQEAVYLGDRVVVMARRPSRVADVVTVELPRPRTIEMRFSRQFLDHVMYIRDALGISHPEGARGGKIDQRSAVDV
ncbi:MAG: ABC transporter ATP-binding protein [Nitrospinota bacterium]